MSAFFEEKIPSPYFTDKSIIKISKELWRKYND